jgi:type IV secretory pathway component VirB8
MSLDFNTLESPKPQTQENSRLTAARSLLVLFCLVLSAISVILSLICLKKLPDFEPVVIQCDPNLLEKIEKQAQILDQIANPTKPSK